MAVKRMFSNKIVGSDAFVAMSVEAKTLYFAAGMQADDDGFINNLRTICAIHRIQDPDAAIAELENNRFIILFDDGVAAIKHWKINNLIRRDRKGDTTYFEHMAALDIDQKGAYVLNAGQMPDKCQTNAGQMPATCPHRIGEDRLGEDRLGESVRARTRGDHKNVSLSDDDRERLIAEYGEELVTVYIAKLSSYIYQTGKVYRDHAAKIRQWIQEDRERERKKGRKNAFHNFGTERETDYDAIVEGISL